MSYRKVTPKELQSLDRKLDEVKEMLENLYTVAGRLAPDDDERFRSAEAVFWLARKVAHDAHVALDDITSQIGGCRNGRFDPEEVAAESES